MWHDKADLRRSKAGKEQGEQSQCLPGLVELASQGRGVLLELDSRHLFGFCHLPQAL